MFGLTDPQMNAVKAKAKQLNAAYDALDKKERKDDKLVASIITKHHEAVATIISRSRFIWIAGYLKGLVGKRENGESIYE
ncbi:hypothetical protein [Escherichia phage P818]|nr:hypothetical protein [Escherichia phage P818]